MGVEGVHEQESLKSRYRHLIESAPVGIYELDLAEQRFTSVNEVMLEYTGYSKEEFMALSPLDLLKEDDRPRFMERIRKVQGGEDVPPKVEYTAVGKHGREFVIELEPRYIFEGGRLRSAHVIAKDVTDLRNVEKALERTTTRYRTVVENAGEVIVVHQMGDVLYSNGRMESITGYTLEEIKRMGLFQLVHPDDRGMLMDHNLTILNGGKVPGKIAARIVGKERTGWAEMNLTKVEWEGAPSILVMATEITDRKLAEERLEHNIGVQRLISKISTDFINIPLESIDVGIVDALEKVGTCIDADRGYVFLLKDEGRLMDNTHEWCREGVEAFKDRLQGLKVDEFKLVRSMLRDRRTIALKSMAELPSDAVAERAEFEREGIRSIVLEPMFIGDRIMGFVGFDYVREGMSNDHDLESSITILSQVITNTLSRRMYQEELVWERNRAELYLDLLSHDIGNLHQGLWSWIEIGRSRHNDNRMVGISLDQSEKLVLRSIKLVRNVLLLSRIPERKKEFTKLDIVPLIQATVQDVKGLYPEMEILIETHLAEGKLEVMAEPIVEEVFQNILQNAVKFQRTEGAYVRIDAFRDGKEVSVSFLDNGPGIPEHIRSNLNRPLREVQRRKHSGLGLPIVAELVRRYNGRISIEDADASGKGTLFTVRFPLAR